MVRSQNIGRSRRKAIATLIVSFSLGGGAHAALAQDYVQAPCQSAAVPHFEDHLQSLWYRRFWTGDCKDLPALGCRSGRPYWNQIVRTVTARTPMDKRADVSTRVCKLGRQIGFEWTRPKAERRIDSRDLKALSATLDQAPDVIAGVAAVEVSVRAKVGS